MSLSKRKVKKIDPTPFDRNKMPPAQNALVMPAVWGYGFLIGKKYGLKIHKENMKGLKPPYLIFASHHSFMDFLITPLTIFPHPANYVSELEGFEYYGEWKYRHIGCLGTRKFVDDMALIKNIKRVIAKGRIMVIYPEARYANVGTNSRLQPSVGKLAKMLKVPVVTVNMKGNYLQSPIWNLTPRKGARLDATITKVFDPEDLEKLSAAEITEKLQEKLTYDDYAYQWENKIKINYEKRAEGLHKALYKCKKCGHDFSMDSKGARIFCRDCNASYYMNEYGRLIDEDDKETSIHIPDYYEWQRQEVIEEIKSGRYHLEMDVHIEALPNAKNFIDLGTAHLVHGEKGFDLTFKDYGEKEAKTMHFDSKSMSSIHTEYDYRGHGQCVTLSTLDNTYFLFPLEEGFNATKIQFAVEALFEL